MPLWALFIGGHFLFQSVSADLSRTEVCLCWHDIHMVFRKSPRPPSAIPHYSTALQHLGNFCGVWHTPKGWCTPSGFWGSTSTRCSEHLYSFINLFLATLCQHLDPQYSTRSEDAEWQRWVKWWHRNHKHLFYFSSGGAWFPVARLCSLFWVRTHGPGTRHWLSVHQWSSPTLLT